MPQITALFWDVGGVLMTNAWDHAERILALEHFHLDPVEFWDRHEMLVSSFERGSISLQQYLDRTIFYRECPFSRQEFIDFMMSLSKPNPDVLEVARSLARSGRYLMATINNESTELNLHRIESNGLREIFSLFVSSCFVGLRKPEEGIYRLALAITQQPPQQCCFIDDRDLNLETAARLGMNVIRLQDAAQLRGDLQKLGVNS